MTRWLRWPLARHSGGVTHIVEPVAQLIWSPERDYADDVPNEDSYLIEFDEGNLFSALRTREADLTKHLSNGNGTDKAATEAEKASEKVAEQQREQEREKARLRLEEENRKNPGGRLLPEFGSDKDFQLRQALNQLKNQPVLVSKTLTERKEEKKDN